VNATFSENIPGVVDLGLNKICLARRSTVDLAPNKIDAAVAIKACEFRESDFRPIDGGFLSRLFVSRFR
jgi:hypothetical protein